MLFDGTLDELMDAGREAAMLIATHEELGNPMIVYIRPDGTMREAILSVPGVHPSTVAKVLLTVEEATMAVLAMESWKVSIKATPEQQAAWAQGIVPSLGMQPKDHPDHYDALVLLGEVKGQPQIQRHWRIHTKPGQRMRTFEAEEPILEGSAQPSRFTPLFVPIEEVRQLAAEAFMSEYLREQTQSSRN